MALKFYVDPTGICDVVDHLVGLILSLRHPGAFTSIEEPLKMSCSILLRLNISLCTSHPQKVLQNAIQDCMEHPEIQTTRRSAGLPLCITAILSAYPPSSNQQNTMEQVVSTLLRELESFDLGLLNPSPSVVHCLNILRTIFRDADLALQSAPFLSGSFKVCFRGFKSSSWAVRNGAMMLFGALVRRAFGSGFGGKERSLTDLRTLVQRHPGLLEFFQIQLLDSSVDIYPLLAVLQRMKFSSGAITSHPAFFKAAINFILQRCISSKALKIRHVSARLVVESLLDFAPELVWPILQPHVLGSGLLTTSCNELHGKLYLLLQASKSHNPIQVTPEDLRILNIYWQTLKLPAAVRWIALLLANRFSAITPSFENIRSTITSCNAIEPYQFDLISTMIVMFKSCDKDMYSLILGIQFSGLQRRLLSFCLGNFCSSEPINGISIENGRVQKPLCQGLSCDTLSRYRISPGNENTVGWSVCK